MRNIVLIMLLMAAVACSKSEIETWTAKPRVWFTNADDTVVFSFYSQPEEVTEYTVEIPITMAGKIASEDREIAFKDLGSGNPESRYEVVSAKIPAGEVTGMLAVKVHKTDNLNTANDAIVFELLPSDVFELGLSEDYHHNMLVISNLLAKPTWWDDENCIYFLGYYSDEKLEIVYTVFGSDEFFAKLGRGEGSWYDDDVTIAIYKLNQYCKENNCTYLSGEPITFDYLTE